MNFIITKDKKENYQFKLEEHKSNRLDPRKIQNEFEIVQKILEIRKTTKNLETKKKEIQVKKSNNLRPKFGELKEIIDCKRNFIRYLVENKSLHTTQQMVKIDFMRGKLDNKK